jgi:hypothetical protein
LQGVANEIAGIEFCDTVRAMFEVAFKFGIIDSAQLIVEILMKGRAGKFTVHAKAPCSQGL